MDLPWTALHPGKLAPKAVVETRSEEDTRKREPVEVWLHNDDYTPAEYVVAVLEKVFAAQADGWPLRLTVEDPS